jgi:D-inositol-3-phosphate glycosyltransferase
MTLHCSRFLSVRTVLGIDNLTGNGIEVYSHKKRGRIVSHDRMSFSRNHNVAIVCFSSSLGGLELSTIQLAREFNMRSADCMLVVPAGTPLAHESAKHHLHAELLSPRMKFGDLLASVRLARMLRAHHTEIVLVMQSKDMSIVAGAKLLYPSAKLVFYQQMQSTINKRDIIHTWMYSKLSLWISLTKRMKMQALEHTRVPERMIRVVPLGRDTRQFDPALYDQRRARKRFDLPLGKRIVGVMGRLDPQKGQQEFLRSLPIVLAKEHDAFYVILGDETKGEEGFRRHLVDLSYELGVQDCVRFLPFTENVPEFLAAIDVFVLPSYSETFGLVLIEAMSMQKPIVATGDGGVPEIVEDGLDGLLIPPRDERALAEAIIRLLKDSSLRAFLSQHARWDALERFDTLRCVDQLVVSLDSL